MLYNIYISDHVFREQVVVFVGIGQGLAALGIGHRDGIPPTFEDIAHH